MRHNCEHGDSILETDARRTGAVFYVAQANAECENMGKKYPSGNSPSIRADAGGAARLFSGLTCDVGGRIVFLPIFASGAIFSGFRKEIYYARLGTHSVHLV